MGLQHFSDQKKKIEEQKDGATQAIPCPRNNLFFPNHSPNHGAGKGAQPHMEHVLSKLSRTRHHEARKVCKGSTTRRRSRNLTLTSQATVCLAVTDTVYGRAVGNQYQHVERDGDTRCAYRNYLCNCHRCSKQSRLRLMSKDKQSIYVLTSVYLGG